MIPLLTQDLLPLPPLISGGSTGCWRWLRSAAAEVLDGSARGDHQRD
jgi:hypothetical protein